MAHDDQNIPSTGKLSTGADNSAADATGGAFAAALKIGLGTSRTWRDWFKRAADEAANRDSLLAYLRNMAIANEEQEDAIRNRYSRATLDWNQLEKRARAHGIAFSVTAQAHHRAAVLDALEDPFAPILHNHRHLTFVQPVDEDGYPDSSHSQPAARALYRLKSRQYPALYPPERNDWTAAEWREHEQRQCADWLAKCSPEARAHLMAWAKRVNAERETGTCATSWRTPGQNGPRRRPELSPA